MLDGRGGYKLTLAALVVSGDAIQYEIVDYFLFYFIVVDSVLIMMVGVVYCRIGKLVVHRKNGVGGRLRQ